MHAQQVESNPKVTLTPLCQNDDMMIDEGADMLTCTDVRHAPTAVFISRYMCVQMCAETGT